jgi:hypothetical protein
MLKKIAKWIGIFIGGLVAIILVVLSFSYLHLRYRINKEYGVVAEDIDIKYDSSTIAFGGRLAGTRGCKECHGQDLGGSELIDDPMIGRFVTRNLTKGKGGLPSDFSVRDWVLAMKHGLNRDGKPLLLMPSHELSHLSEGDMAAIIAYCTQVPPVDREEKSFRIGPMGYVLSEFGLIPMLPAELTDHSITFPKPVERTISVEYGKYLSTVCVNCHGPNLKGGQSPVPGGKYVADITATGNPGKWSDEQFITALHTGETPEGKHLNPSEMPWPITKNFTPDELKAVHMDLLSIK